MPISATELQALKPKKKPYKVSIGKGAYLLVTSAGKKYWRLKYRLDGRESTYSLGVFPNVSLDAAKASRESARALIREGSKPSVVKRAARVTSANTQAVFRLELSTRGALTIETEANALTLTFPQTQALAAFLAVNTPIGKNSQ
jgi:hypothetical protein